MSGVNLVIILLMVLLLILFLTRLRVRLSYRRRGKDDEFAFELSLWRGLVFYTFEVPVIEMKKKKARPKTKPGLRWGDWLLPRPAFKIKAEVEGKAGRPVAEDTKDVRVPGPDRLLRLLSNAIRLFKTHRPAILYLLGRVYLRSFQWRTEVGTGDPAQTGFLAGVAWSLKGVLLSIICRLSHRGGTRPVVQVAPVFEKACFNTTLECVFDVRIGHLFLSAFKILLRL